MIETYKVIADLDELKWFYDHILVHPRDGESYMICHSARSKKLNDDERNKYGVGKRGEMFHTEVTKKFKDKPYEWMNFLSCISKFEVNKFAYLTQNDLPYPDKCLVTYIYMNPSSEAACAEDTLNRVNEINQELINAGINHSVNGINESIWKLSTIGNHIKSCHAQNPSRRVYIDFDIDCHDLDDRAIDIIRKNTNNYFGKGFGCLVRTGGGLHILVKKDRLNFNPFNFTNALTKDLQEDYTIDEIKKNDNVMIPLPGTYQYGKCVTIINKEDYE